MTRDSMREVAREGMRMLEEQIVQDSLTEIRARLPGHSETYYNQILNKAQVTARKNGRLSTFEIVTSKEFWVNEAL